MRVKLVFDRRRNCEKMPLGRGIRSLDYGFVSESEASSMAYHTLAGETLSFEDLKM